VKSWDDAMSFRARPGHRGIRQPPEEVIVSQTRTRVDKIATVIIAVADQEAQIAFYTDKLGFEKRVDMPFGDKYRWVEVGPADGETTIALAPPPPDGQAAGNAQTGISLHADDVDAYHAELKEAGVDVDPEVSRMGDPVPPMFWLRDPENNSLVVVG
jgi:catechol 2,3-dioxygenase-like lactoylglutathione lyase family enzyme